MDDEQLDQFILTALPLVIQYYAIMCEMAVMTTYDISPISKNHERAYVIHPKN